MPQDRPLLEPRCMTPPEAAAYCGLTPSGFRSWVMRGTLPPALPGTRRWDRKAIDAALDRLSNLTPDTPVQENDFERWKLEKELRDVRRGRVPTKEQRGSRTRPARS